MRTDNARIIRVCEGRRADEGMGTVIASIDTAPVYTLHPPVIHARRASLALSSLDAIGDLVESLASICARLVAIGIPATRDNLSFTFRAGSLSGLFVLNALGISHRNAIRDIEAQHLHKLHARNLRIPTDIMPGESGIVLAQHTGVNGNNGTNNTNTTNVTSDTSAGNNARR